MYESMRFNDFPLPKWLFSILCNFVSKIYIKSCPNAPIISQAENFKILIFSHGLAAHR